MGKINQEIWKKVAEILSAERNFPKQTSNDDEWTIEQVNIFFDESFQGSTSNVNGSIKYLIPGSDIVSYTLNQSIPSDFDLRYINQIEARKEENQTISEVLGNETVTNELKAFIVGLYHTEQVIINSTQGGNRKKITITGYGARIIKRVKFSGGSEYEGKGLFIINVGNDIKSDIIIENIEMLQWKGGCIKSEGGNSITLQYCIFNGGGAIIHNNDVNLEITLCEFKGDGQNAIMDSFITATKGIINIINSSFQQGSFFGQDKGCIVCKDNCQQCLIEGNEFNSRKLESESAYISITSSQCTLLSVKGSLSKRTIFSGLGINDSLSGYFVKSIAAKIDISFTDFTYATFIDNGNALFIVDSQQSYNSNIIREVSISDCIFKYLRGQENCGSIIIDMQTQFTISFSQNFFSENIGIKVSDVLIIANNETDMTISNFTNSFSDSLKPHIQITQGLISTFYNLTLFKAYKYVTINESKEKSYQRIIDAINDLNNDTTSLLYYPRTIYILDEAWNESIENIYLDNSLVIKSGLQYDIIGKRIQPLWTTESNSSIIDLISGDLTLENIQFSFIYVDKYVTPLMCIINSNGTQSTNLTIIQCTFTGLDNELIIGYFITFNSQSRMILKDCIFQDLQRLSHSSVSIRCYDKYSYFLLQNCSFLNIFTPSNQVNAVFSIWGYGFQFKLLIIGCLFQNCSCLNSQYSGAISIDSHNSNNELVIHGSRFINNTGQQSGALNLNISSTNCRFFDNEFSNNQRTAKNQTGNDAYLNLSQVSSSFKDINISQKIQSMFIGSTSYNNNSVYFNISDKYFGSINLDKPLIIRFIDQNASEGGTGEEDKPMKSINFAQQNSVNNLRIEIILINPQHNENIFIDETIVWDQIHIKAEVEEGTTMFRDNEELENAAIIQMTPNSITPTTVQNVMMNVSSGFFVIQKSKIAILTLQNIIFISNGTIQQNGSSLLLINSCSFHTFDDKFKSNSFVSALQGQLKIAQCQIGTNSITYMRNSAIQAFSLCTDIKISKSNFTNLHSQIEDQEISSACIVIIVGDSTHVSINECFFHYSIDSGNDNTISSGAILIISEVISTKPNTSSSSFLSQNLPFTSFFKTKEHNNENVGDVSITNCHFSECSGNNVGGIFFGENVIPISAQNNTFTNNSYTSQIVNGSADIFFSSKILLDQSGGIVEVCKGYKCSLNSKKQPTGEVKIDGFSSNFASYLNCISYEGQECEDLPCGGQIGITPESCQIVDPPIDPPVDPPNC